MSLAEIPDHESESVEFKRSLAEVVKGMQTVCAMLNSPVGGTVYFGVANNGRVVGLDVGERTHDKLRNEINKIDPRIQLEVQTIPTDHGRSILAIRAPGNTGLYQYDGRSYARVGASTGQMAERTYQRRLLESWHSTTRWENQPARSIGVDDLDHDEIRRTVADAVRNGRLIDPGSSDVKTLLTGFGLTANGSLINAAAVMFGVPSSLSVWYPQCTVRLARFEGLTKSAFRDNRQYTGNLFHLLRVTQEFLVDHLPVASRILPGRIERQDMPLYPPEAIREALVNAFAHRDYAEGGGSVDVALFDDRLEISSTGGLRFGLTVGDLLQDHQSRAWNPIITSVLQRRGISENWGRGTLRILELTRSAGLPDPDFVDKRIAFVVRFRGQPVDGIPVRTQSAQFLVLETLREIGPASLSDLETRLGGRIRRRELQRVLQTLREDGRVGLEGSRRWARWFVAED